MALNDSRVAECDIVKLTEDDALFSCFELSLVGSPPFHKTPNPKKEAVMKKAMAIFSAALLATGIFLLVAHGQMLEKGTKNTMTLPNGDVIWDLNGEWDAKVENYGSWSGYGSYSSGRKITQKGNSIEVIRITSDPWNKAGSIALVGELDKQGSIKGTAPTYYGSLDMKGQVIENGNKIVIDDGEKAKATFTRK
jgi:hypothetical protein